MNGAEKIARRLYGLQSQVDRIGRASQLGNTTIAGESAVAVSDVVTEAAVTNDALPDVQVDAADSNESASDLTAMFDSFDDDMNARFENARAELDDAQAQNEEAQRAVSDAFGLQFDGMSEDIQTAIRAAGAAQDTADGIPLILFSTVRGPSNGSDLAPTGSTWFYLDTSNNIAGQWQQTGPKSTPTWTPRQIVSDVIANLDVGKLTAGQAAIAQLVAQKIAASTANFQTVNVSNLFVTSGATMNQATIDYLFANVVQAKKITAGMLDANAINGMTITGAVFKSAASGQRIEVSGTSMLVYDAAGTNVATLFGDSTSHQLVLSGLPVTGSDEQRTASGKVYIGANGASSGGSLGVGSSLQTDAADFTKRVRTPILNTPESGSIPSFPVISAPGGSTDTVLTTSRIALKSGTVVGGTDFMSSTFVGGDHFVQVRVSQIVDRATNKTFDISDSGWTNITITAGNADTTNPPQYRRLGGVVYLRGLITPTTTLQTIGNLPAGFRPGISGEYSCVRTPGGTATVAFWDVRVQAGGNVALMGPSGGNGNVNLNAISFIAEN